MIVEDVSSQIRDVLRDAGTVVVRVGLPDVPSSPESDINKTINALRSGNFVVRNIVDLGDLSIWGIGEAVKRMKMHQFIKDRKPLSALEKLFVCAAIDGLLSRRTNYCISKTAIKYLLESKQELVHFGLSAIALKRLTGYFSAGDTRGALIQLSNALFSEDAHNIMKRLDLPFTMRPPSRSPDWSRQFQEITQPASVWFDDIVGGHLLFIVYYSGKCRYGQCQGCNLPDMSSNKSVTSQELFEQTDYIYKTYLGEDEKSSITTVILSNNGSLFDQETVSHAALLYAICRAIEHLPSLSKIVIETRCEFVNDSALSHIRAVLSEVDRPIHYELAVGVEAHDEQIRNRLIRKGLSNRGLERVSKSLAKNSGSLRCYYMLKPVPGMDEKTAIEDIISGHEYLESLAREYEIPILMHLNPTFAAIGTELETAFQEGLYSPPSLSAVVNILQEVRQRNVTIHIGLNDEGLATEGGSFIHQEDISSLSILQQYNRIGKLPQ